MSGLADARSKLPALANLDDAQFVDAVHKLYYPGMDRSQLEEKLGYTAPAAAQAPAGVVRTAGDVAVKLGQGVVDLGSAVVGAASLATGGKAGEFMREKLGYDPEGTNEFLGQYLSDSQKAADEKVAAADGFVDTIAASLENPRSILGTVAQSAPGMVGGMAVARAAAARIASKAALATAEGSAASSAALASGKTAAQATAAAMETQAGAAAAKAAVQNASGTLIGIGAGTEGAQTAGMMADRAQAAGREYSDYALPSIAAGATTAAIGLGAGKLMGDAATEIATGAAGAGARGNIAARIGKQAFSEGVLEEMPQSAQEQVFTNMAMGEQDLSKGVSNAAATGLLAGAAMGGGMGALQRNNTPAPTPPVLPNTGPLSQAANAGQAAAATVAAAAAPAAPEAPAEAPARTLDDIDARLAELMAIGQGTPAQRVEDELGFMKTVPGVPARRYTPEEQAEYRALLEERKQRVAIPPEQADAYRQLELEEAAEKAAAMQSSAAQSSPIEAQAQAQRAAAEEAQAQRAAAEEAEIQRLIAEEEAQQHAAAEQANRALMDETNARVERDMLTRAAANRKALRDSILSDSQIPAAEKKNAFQEAMKREGFTFPVLTPEDEHAIDSMLAEQRRVARDWVLNDDSVAPADKAAEIARAYEDFGFADPTLSEDDHAALAEFAIPATPNELVDAVPERAPVAPAAPASPNTAAVDAAIASGMRLKTAGGSVLHKKGSSKIFKLNTAQKAYYLERMAALGEVAPAAPAPAAAPAPLEQAQPIEQQVQDFIDGKRDTPPEVPAPATPAPTPKALDLPTIEHDGDTWHILSTGAEREGQIFTHLSSTTRGTQQKNGVNPAQINDWIDAAAIAGAKARFELDKAAHEAATSPQNDRPEPTDAQKEAGNYKKGHTKLHGLDISIENPAGSVRRGVDPDGNAWETEMRHHYGDILGTKGADGDPVDVFIGDSLGSEKVFVVDQVDPRTGKFDEHKVMLGFDSLEDARAAYQANYDAGWTGGRDITETTVEAFKDWLSAGTTTKPFVKAPVVRSAQIAAAKESNAEYDGNEAAMRGFSMAPPANWRTQAQRDAWERGWIKGRDARAKMLDGAKQVVVGERYAYPTVAVKDGEWTKVWRDERAGKDYRTAEAAEEALQVAAAADSKMQQELDALPPRANSTKLTKIELNKMTVKDMTDEQLLQARTVLAETARAPKIEKEIERRKLDEKAKAQAERDKRRANARAHWKVGMPTSLDTFSEIEGGPKQIYTQMLPGVIEAIDGDTATVRIYASPEYGYNHESYPLHGKRAINVPLTELGRHQNHQLQRIIDAGLLAEGDPALAADVRARMAPHLERDAKDKAKAVAAIEKEKDNAPADSLEQQLVESDRKKAAAPKAAPAEEPEADAAGDTQAPEHARLDGTGPKTKQFTSPELLAAAEEVKNVNGAWVALVTKYDQWFTPHKDKTSKKRKLSLEAPTEVHAALREWSRRATAASDAYNNALTAPKLGVAKDQPIKEQAPIDDSKILMEMDKFAFATVTDEWAALFAEPGKDERVSMDKRATEELTPEQAEARIQEWRAHALRQGEEHRRENFQRTVLSLFDLTGEWSQPWRDAGYNVVTFDIQSGQDVFDFSVEYFTENYDLTDVYCILAATPCTDFASSGAKHFLKKDADGRTEQSVALVNKAAATIEYFRPAVWALENPVGRLSNLTGLPEPRLSFQPHHFGDPYTKRTMIWGQFNAELPTANVHPSEGSKMHSQYGGSSIETKNARSETPEGFAYAFFMANNYIDMPAERRLATQYPEASGAVVEALKAGISADEIHQLIEYDYGNENFEDVRNALIDAVAARKRGTAASEEAAPAPAAAQVEQVDQEPVDDGADIPIAFYKKVKVPIDVLIEDEGRYESVEMPADKALASVREDITNLRALLRCMGG